jgi:hypothetical protein
MGVVRQVLGFMALGVVAVAVASEAAKRWPPGDAVSAVVAAVPMPAPAPETQKVEPPVIDREAQAKRIAADVPGRKSYAAEYEKSLLRQGMSVTITAEGDRATTLKISYPLMSKALAFQLSEKSDQIENWRRRGFRKVVLTDGFNETWDMSLTPKAASK